MTTLQTGTFTTLFGTQADAVVAINGHSWAADSKTGLYTTGADLASEWKADYQALLTGQPLNFIQHLEANMEAAFEFTGLNSIKAGQLALDRMDVQRQLDAMAQAMVNAGVSLTGAMTEQDYLKVGNAMQGNATLEELGMQGHGLNNSPVARYRGYTNDFQNNVDGATLYVGGGLDNNQNALAAFVDDVTLSHLPFPVVAQNSALQQLNQNGDAEDTLTDAVGALDYAGTKMVLTSASFSKTPGSASDTPYAPPASATATPPAGKMYSLTGFLIPTTITVNGDTWTAGADGLYVTTADLAGAWTSAYKAMQAGNGATLTAAQFLEGNAEAVFENTGLAKVAAYDPNQLAMDRMDVQREIDAIVGALQAAGINPNKPLTTVTWIEMQHALQNSPALQELALQGHGLNSPDDPRYNGYTEDFQNNVDRKTLYIGAGPDSGTLALPDFFDDAVLAHAGFPVIVQYGLIRQLNQNGDAESTVQLQVDEYNAFRFNFVLKPTDFNIPGNPIGEPAAGTTTTLTGATIASTVTVNGDAWTVGADGRYHTTTNLQTLWEGYYQTMLNGGGASLTAIQRMEGNAEAVFDNTGLNNRKRYNFAKQQSFREDAAREFDAIGAAMSKLGLGKTLLNTSDYLNVAQAIQSNAVWEELAIQGHGLNDAPSGKYRGYTGDFQNNSDNSTYYVGGGIDNGEKAIAQFFDDINLTHLSFPVVSQNGVLEQLNQNGAAEDTLVDATAAMNEAMFTRVFVASDFSTNCDATGAVVYVSPAMATATPPALPVAGPGQILSLTGTPISATQTVNGHIWTADANGRYVTSTDLTLEWWNSYTAAQAGQALTLTQKWEAQAEAVFLNTNLSKASEGQQAIDRMDVQREIDAVVAVMGPLGLGAKPLTTADYLKIGTALQGNAALEQLAVEGHGLDNPWQEGATEYNGWANDMPDWVDSKALYVGPGPDDGQRALGDFFGNDVMTNLPFAVIFQDGELTQLNENGNAASTLNAAVQGMNGVLFGSLLNSGNFQHLGAMPSTETPPTPPATITGFYGETLPGSVTVNGHLWVADSTGTYQTAANLQIEWRGFYQDMLAGKGASMTATQRLEGNMEAYFENTGINTIYNGACKEANMRVDLQRVIDAIAGAQQIDLAKYGVNPARALTEASYLQLSNTLHGDDQLEELALQGFGMVNPPSNAYRGAYKDVFSSTDWSAYFVGGGADNGLLANPYVMPDMLGNLPFGTVYVNGAWTTTGVNGSTGETALQAAGMMNQAMYGQVFVAGDFSQSASASGPVVAIPGAASSSVTPVTAVKPLAGCIVTLSGAEIACTMTANGHVWTADASGLFHTANLSAEWQGYYKTMLAGTGASLTAIQRNEGNAEAVFEAAGVTKLSAATQQMLREDVQRQLDAEAAATPITAPLTQASYLQMSRKLQSDNALEELALQGHGVTGTGAARYAGVIGDAAGLSGTVYKGGGVNNWSYALATFLQQNILGDAPFAETRQNGKWIQLDQTGYQALSLANQITALNDTMFNKTLAKTAFR